MVINNPSTGTGVRLPSGGYASAGIKVYSGSKKTGATLIAGTGGSVDKANKEPYNITTASGEEVEVTPQENTSYKSVEAARQKSLNKAGTLSRQQTLEYLKAQQANQAREIAIDYAAVENANKNFAAAGIKNASDFFTAVKSGELTSNTDSEGNTQYTLTKTTTTTIGGEEGLTEAQAAEVNKEYFGGTQKLINLTKNGLAELNAGIKYRFQPSGMEGITKVNQAPDTRIITGGAKTIFYGSAAAISGLFESATYALFRNPDKNKYDFNKGVSENDFKTALLLEQKERQQSQAGAFALGTLGVFMPGFTLGINAASRAKLGVLAAKESFGNFETKGIDALELQLRGRTYQKPYLAQPNSPEAAEGRSIIGGKSTGEGLGLVQPKEIQAQIYPKKIPLTAEEMKIGEYFRLSSSEGLPSKAEISEAFGNKKLTSDFGIVKESPPKIVTNEKIFKIFREENPATKATELRDFSPTPKATKPVKGLFETPAENIEIDNKLYEYNPNTKKLVLLGNKKGQSTSLIFDNSNSLEYNRRNPNLFTDINPEERLIIPPTEVNPESTGLFIPVATSAFFKTGSKPINELDIKSFSVTNSKNSIISANIPKSNLFTGNKAVSDTSSSTEQSFRSSIKSSQSAAQIVSQKQEQETQQEVIQIQATTASNPFKQTSTFKFDIQKPKEENRPRTPPTLPKSKMNFGAASGFNVLIKKAGVWNKVNPQPLTRGEAVNYGAYTIERTPQASFRITPANKPATGRFKAPASLSNFYTKGSTYIEKPSKRINTIGELAGITFKGLNIKRNKLKGWF